MKTKFDSLINTIDCDIRMKDYEKALRGLMDAVEMVARAANVPREVYKRSDNKK